MAEEGITIDTAILGVPFEERVPVVALRTLLLQREKLDEDQEVEIQLIHKKYTQKIKPLLDRASQLIQGNPPLPEEVTKLSQYLKKGEKAPQLKGKVIDRYWNAALQNSNIAQYISQKDQKALEFLLDIQIVEENIPGINLKFIFKANPYFTETSIIRRIKFAEGKPNCVEGDLVTWKAGSWLNYESKKVSNKSTGETKITKGKKVESFFDTFDNWQVSQDPDELQKCYTIFSELQLVIKDSLSFFLGLYEAEDEQQSEEYEQDDDDEDQVVDVGKKGRKK